MPSIPQFATHNAAISSFVHQLADESVGMTELLISPLRLEPETSLPLPLELFGPHRPNSAGLDLTVLLMRAPLLQAFEQVHVPHVAFLMPNWPLASLI